MRTLFSPRLLAALACLVIILVGGGMRLAGSNWDEGANLHPDERHMMFVVSDTLRAFETPEANELPWYSIWFETGTSPLDPRLNDRLYVYGELPHMVVSLLARATGMTGWPDALWVGRTVSAVLDSYTILAVFIIAAASLRNMGGAVVAAGLYAFTPLAIQHANFFTVDVWLTAATAWFVLVAILLMQSDDRARALWLSGIGGALAAIAMACKIPGAMLCPILGAVILARFWLHPTPDRLRRAAVELLISAIATIVVFRLASPFTFEGPGLFNLMPSAAFLKGYVGMTQLILDPGFPPNWQWLSGYGPLNALFDFFFWALGPALTAALLASIVVLAARWRQERLALLPAILVILAFGAYGLSGPAPALRYLLPAAPALCVIAALFISLVSLRGRILSAAVLVTSLVWGSGMFTLHTHTVSRVAASRWLWLNSEPGTVLANESGWDDGLPVPVMLPGETGLVWGDRDQHFTSLQLHLEYADNAEKAHNLAQTLGQTDLLILSSERLRKPMLALPERFPMTGRYYEMLASGELCFAPVYRYASSYPVAGFMLRDSNVQETWSVYDHPAVEIYRRQDCYDAAKTEAALLQALDSGS